MEKILFVSHCYFNDAAKLKFRCPKAQETERSRKRTLLKKFLDEGIELIQLPCPELILYGSNRWGHIAPQFDTPFFREQCRQLLSSYLLQIQEYAAYPQRFQLLGVLGIDGSPSCGVNFTCGGDWGGEFSSNPHLDQTLASACRTSGSGIFMDEFQKILKEKEIILPFYSMETLPESLSFFSI